MSTLPQPSSSVQQHRRAPCRQPHPRRHNHLDYRRRRLPGSVITCELDPQCAALNLVIQVVTERARPGDGWNEVTLYNESPKNLMVGGIELGIMRHAP